MKQKVTLCGLALVAIVSICFGETSPAKPGKSAAREAKLVDLEKIVTEAFKTKQIETFKKYLAPEFVALDAEGIKNTDAEVADIPKYDVRENSFADMKVVFPSGKVAVITYKVTTQATHAGQDTSGTYNVASVWMRREKKWLLVFHTFMKSQ
jgi:uncharacterized protein DUF4440